MYSSDEILHDIGTLEKDVHEATKVVKEVMGPEVEPRARTISVRSFCDNQLLVSFSECCVVI